MSVTSITTAPSLRPAPRTPVVTHSVNGGEWQSGGEPITSRTCGIDLAALLKHMPLGPAEWARGAVLNDRDGTGRATLYVDRPTDDGGSVLVAITIEVSE